MNYVIRDRCIRNIASFYNHVARKYRNTYTKQLMHKNLDEAIDAMFLIEQSLLRRRPTLKRWQNQGWDMAHAGHWYYAYTVSDHTVTIEDACHEQNMHEDAQM